MKNHYTLTDLEFESPGYTLKNMALSKL